MFSEPAQWMAADWLLLSPVRRAVRENDQLCPECDSLFCRGARLSSRNHTLPQLQPNTQTWKKDTIMDLPLPPPFQFGRKGSYLCISGERGMNYSRQELAVDGGGWDNLSRGHGRDAVQRLILGILVLHSNRTHAYRSQSFTEDKQENVPPHNMAATGCNLKNLHALLDLAMLILGTARLMWGPVNFSCLTIEPLSRMSG